MLLSNLIILCAHEVTARKFISACETKSNLNSEAFVTQEKEISKLANGRLERKYGKRIAMTLNGLHTIVKLDLKLFCLYPLTGSVYNHPSGF